MSYRSYSTDSILVRASLIAFAVAFVVFAVLASTWNLANAISTRADTKDLADIVSSLAPDDPQTRYAAGVIYDKTFEPADADRSLAEFEAAATKTPNNYLIWLALAKARGRNGDANGEELAAKSALDLAPNYASVHWAYGNVLFRKGDDLAMQHIRRAAETDKQFRVPAVDLMMLRFDGDVAAVRAGLGESPTILAAISQNLIRQQKFSEAQRVWESIDFEERHHSLAEQAISMASAAMNAKQFRFAQTLFKDGGQLSGRIGEIHDGGFESGVKVRAADIFEWQIGDGAEPQIAMSNSTKHGGENSLLLQFNTMEASAFRRVAQTIAADPGTSLKFSAYYRSELKARSTMRFVISDATSGKELARSENFAESSDWRQVTASFVVPNDSDGIVVTLIRGECGSSVCPISGRVWIDDVALSR